MKTVCISEDEIEVEIREIGEISDRDILKMGKKMYAQITVQKLLRFY